MKALSLLLCVVPLFLFAEEKDLKNSVNAGWILNQGNSETFRIQLGAESLYKKDGYEWLGNFKYSYGESEESDGSTKTNVDNMEGKIQYNYLYTGNSYTLISLDYRRDELANLDYRILGTIGLGHYWIREEKTTFNGEMGLSYRKEKTSDEEDEHPALLLAQRWEHHWGENTRAWDSLEYKPTFDDFSDFLFSGEVGIAAKLNGHLSLRMVLTVDYDSEPPSDTEKTDLKFVSGISVDF